MLEQNLASNSYLKSTYMYFAASCFGISKKTSLNTWDYSWQEPNKNSQHEWLMRQQAATMQIKLQGSVSARIQKNSLWPTLRHMGMSPN